MDTKEKKPAATRPQKAAAPTAGKPRTAPPRKRRAPASKRPSPDVVYTQPGPFNRNRFLLQLLTIVAVVLALLFGMSVFFKVKDVTVAGTNKYTAWDVRQASGIQDGENLMTISEARISSNIRAKLPYVDTVRVGIKLPDTVHIEIVERTVVYAAADTMSNWWLLNAEGRIIDKADAAAVKSYTQILGVKLQGAVIGEQAVASEVVPTTATEEAALPVSSGKDRLSDALLVIKALENNGIMGNVDSIDVTDSNTLNLVYEDRFRINLGDNSRMDYKIASVKAAVNEHLGEYDQGYLDASFTTYPNEIGFNNSSDTKN